MQEFAQIVKLLVLLLLILFLLYRKLVVQIYINVVRIVGMEIMEFTFRKPVLYVCKGLSIVRITE